MGMEAGIANQMLLFQVSKSPTINNNLLVTYTLPPALLVFSLKDWWKMAGGDVWEAEDVRDYNRN